MNNIIQDEIFLPEYYKLYLNINSKNLSYIGNVNISIEIKKSTDKIVINSNNLLIENIFLNSIAHNYEYDKSKSIILINHNFVVGNYVLEFNFHNKISTNMKGIYYSKKNNKIIISTQLEPDYAQRVFPCFDSPNFKSNFELSIKIDNDYNCISNMPLINKNILYENENKYTIYNFEKTPIMSCYLLGFVIGPIVPVFSKPLLTSSGVKINGYCLEEDVKYMEWSVQKTKESVEYFEKWFGINYVLPKLDIVSIPSFSSGAMENWGIITFREKNILLYDISNTFAKINILEVIYHEIAHQWFGNLVTLKDWSNLWLNESFATFFSWNALEEKYKYLPICSINYLDNYYNTLVIDSLEDTHPIITKNINNINDIFDEISYSKGSCLIKYLNELVGKKVTKNSIHEYLKDNSFSNTTSDDLFKYFLKNSNLDIKKLLLDMTTTSGFPILNISIEEDFIVININKFNLNKKKEKYNIPFFINLVEIINEKKNLTLIKLEKEITKISIKKDNINFYLNNNNEFFCILNYININLPFNYMKNEEVLKYISDNFIISYYSFEKIYKYINLISNMLNKEKLLLDIINFKFIICSINKIFFILKLQNNVELYDYLISYTNKILNKIIDYTDYFITTEKYFIENLVDELLVLLCIHLKIEKFIILSKYLFFLNFKNFVMSGYFKLSKSLFKIINFFYPKYTLLIYNLLEKNISPIIIDDIFQSFEFISNKNYEIIISSFKDSVQLQDYSMFITCLAKNCLVQNNLIDFVLNDNTINENDLIFSILKNISFFIFSNDIINKIKIFINKSNKKKINYIAISRILNVLDTNKNILSNN